MPITVTRRAAVAAVVGAVLLIPLTGCSSSGDGGSTQDAQHAGHEGHEGHGGSEDAKTAVTLTVLADMSLIDVFKQEAAAYRKQNPGVHVTFSFAGAQQLATQVEQGVGADVLVTDDRKTMAGVSSKTSAEPRIIARNRLVIAVGEGNPKKIAELRDLSAPGLKVVLAAPEVPAGVYSRKVLDGQHVRVHPTSGEPNVRAVLTKVEFGDADAGLVYRTDAATLPGKVDAITIPAAQNTLADYPAAPLKGSAHAKEAAAFVTWLSSPTAQKILQDAGFQKP
jgi:molybdate transport system substrate-binding protein